MTLNFDLLTPQSEVFISVPKCINAISLVEIHVTLFKIPREKYSGRRPTHAQTETWRLYTTKLWRHKNWASWSVVDTVLDVYTADVSRHAWMSPAAAAAAAVVDCRNALLTGMHHSRVHECKVPSHIPFPFHSIPSVFHASGPEESCLLSCSSSVH